MRAERSGNIQTSNEGIYEINLHFQLAYASRESSKSANGVSNLQFFFANFLHISKSYLPDHPKQSSKVIFFKKFPSFPIYLVRFLISIIIQILKKICLNLISDNVNNQVRTYFPNFLNFLMLSMQLIWLIQSIQTTKSIQSIQLAQLIQNCKFSQFLQFFKMQPIQSIHGAQSIQLAQSIQKIENWADQQIQP